MKITAAIHTNSKRPRVEINSLGAFVVYVSQPPHNGKANKAVIEALAKYFKVAKSRVVLIRGAKSKTKTFNVMA